MIFSAIKLEFNSPLLISRGWGGYENSDFIIHSDTLKAAIYAVGLNLFPDWRDHYAEYNSQFSISSCFPYIKNEYFFPVLFPDKNQFILQGDDTNYVKILKKIEYLSKKTFEKFINGEKIIINTDQIIGEKFLVDHVSSENASVLFIEEVQQRVSVQPDAQTRPFLVNRIHFKKNTGLFFLADFKNNEIKTKVLKVLKLLGSLGLGTDRTIGNGFFDFEPEQHVDEKFILNTPEKYNAFMNLGMYWPLMNEVNSINWEKSSWNIVPRGGYIAGSEYVEFRHLFKKTVFMFSPGSIFQLSFLPKGSFGNLQPDWNDDRMHKVYRCGQPVFIPVVNIN